MGVRSQTHKYIWREWRDPEDKSSVENVELFDLKKDENEINNVAETNSGIASQMHDVVARRLAEIPEYCENRDAEALHKNGVAKYLR